MSFPVRNYQCKYRQNYSKKNSNSIPELITEKFTDFYASYTTEEICYETICELVPETTTTFDYPTTTELWTNPYLNFTETYDTTTDISMYDTFMEFDNAANINLTGDNATLFSRDNLTKLISNMTEEDQLELRRLCWETMFGQELVKLTVVDLVRDGN